MAAMVQAGNAGPNPILLRYDIMAGHAGGMPVEAEIDETTEMLSFLGWRLGWSVD